MVLIRSITMRAFVVVLAVNCMAVPVSPYRIAQGQGVLNFSSGHRDHDSHNASSAARPDEHRRYFDAEIPPIFSKSELKGHRALDSVHGVAEYVVMPGMAMLCFVILIGAWLSLQRYTALIPESAWTVLFSTICGWFVRGLLNAGMISDHRYVWATATALNLMLLPIIIFESGWALNHKNFLSQIEYITTFAVFGTLISFGFVGFGSYWLGSMGYLVVTDLREHLAFAALISAVDPVATLSTFSKLGLDSTQPLLHTMIFGESVINDAVAIVLFHTINDSWEDLTVRKSIYDIAVLLFGSAGFGIVVSSLLVMLMRIARLPGNTVQETLYIVASAWLVFAAAEGASYSGIIANLVAGGIFRGYGAQHLDEKGVEKTSEFLHISAHFMDTLVFMLCGLSTALIDSFRGLEFGLFGFALCLIGRAMSTSSCAMISNCMKWFMREPASHMISFSHQCMMWHAGLRGGIALLLALELDASWCAHKATIINGTFIIICATLVLLGSTTEPLLKLLAFQSKKSEGEEGEEWPHSQDSTSSLLLDQDKSSLIMNMKRAMLETINSGFMFVLVGDPATVARHHEKRANFMQSVKSQAKKFSSLVMGGYSAESGSLEDAAKQDAPASASA